MTNRSVQARVLVRWDGVNWVDESNLFLSAQGALELVKPAQSVLSGDGIIQQCTLTFANENDRYSFFNSAGALYSYIQNGDVYGTALKLAVSIDGGAYSTIFTGRITQISVSYSDNRATFTVKDSLEFLKKALSTSVLIDYLAHDLIIHYLTLGGMVDGVDFRSPTYADTNSVEATIAFSTVRIPYSWLDDETPLDEIRQILQATGGRLYVDPDGLIRYELGWLWSTAHLTALSTETASSISDISPSLDDRSFADEVIVEYAQRYPGAAGTEVWTSEEAIYVAPGETERIEAKFSSPVTGITPLALTIMDVNGVDLSADVTIGTTVYAQRCVIEIANGSGSVAVIPVFSIRGVPLFGRPSKQLTETSGEGYEYRVEVRGNFYVQTKQHASYLAKFLLWYYTGRKLMFSLQGMQGSAARLLNRRVTVTASPLTATGVITRVSFQVSSSNTHASFRQDIECIDSAPFEATLFIIGVSPLETARSYWH